MYKDTAQVGRFNYEANVLNNMSTNKIITITYKSIYTLNAVNGTLIYDYTDFDRARPNGKVISLTYFHPRRKRVKLGRKAISPYSSLRRADKKPASRRESRFCFISFADQRESKHCYVYCAGIVRFPRKSESNFGIES
ncbi:hypothetical protein EVAR_36477_1 [Eumeta japonica]|uniref:Uncharacterized protein n=1 Tax=Eumeta variegata TaxID=151549 RepID=A0A4C1WUG4_EUMVA|nr:hypothetical protein EVAR_36477_1 [Eumeta japonica]